MTDIMFLQMEKSLRAILVIMNNDLVSALDQAETGDVSETERYLNEFNSNSQKLMLIMKSAEAMFDKPQLNDLAKLISPEIATVTKTKAFIDELVFYRSLNSLK